MELFELLPIRMKESFPDYIPISSQLIKEFSEKYGIEPATDEEVMEMIKRIKQEAKTTNNIVIDSISNIFNNK